MQIPSVAHHSMPQQAIPLHVLAEIQRAMAHASVVAKQAGGVPCNPNDIFMQGADLPTNMKPPCFGAMQTDPCRKLCGPALPRYMTVSCTKGLADGCDAACVMCEGFDAVAAAQAQQQGNANIIPLMHSLAHFMPQMSLPGSAHSVSQPPSVMAPPQTGAHAASMPSGFPSFVMAPSSGGVSAMPWPLVSQPPHSFQVVPPAASAAAVPAAPDAGPGSALAPAVQPVDAQAEGGPASEAPASGVFSALLEEHASPPQDAAEQQAVQLTSAALPVQDSLAVQNSVS